MNATQTAPRTKEELLAAARASAPETMPTPNRAFAIMRYVDRAVATAERAAYAEQARRTIRREFIAALYERRTQTTERERTLAAKWNVARREAGVRYDWTPELTDNSELARLRRECGHSFAVAGDAANMLAAATYTGGDLAHLLDLAERGEIIEPSMLMSIVPDEFGRISPFAVSVRRAGADREFVSRNYRLIDAVRAVETAIERGDTASVFYDTCG